MCHCRFAGLKWALLTAMLAFLLPTVATAQAVAIQVTATEVFDPMNMLGSGPVGALISPGTVTCPGAQPTGNPMQPCPPGSRINLRNVSWESRLASSSALLTGWLYTDTNSAFDTNFTGQVWGTFRIELDDGGAWEGSVTADRCKVGGVWVVRNRGVGRGVGSAVDGMHLRFTEVAPMLTSLPLGWLGSMDAEILVPPSR